MSNQAKLQEVLSNIKQTVAKKQLPIVIFDLDDTLFATATRDMRIIREFAADNADTHPDFAAVAAKMTLGDMQWSALNALLGAGLDKDSPSLKPFGQYWLPTFFSDNYVANDLPNPGAVDYVNACHNAGALIFYLTGRHYSDRGRTIGTEQGTVRALTTRGFPFWKGRCELTLKPPHGAKDVIFKANALEAVKSLHGQVVATFDNEPANCNMFLAHFPDALNFWLKTTWNPTDNDVDPKLITIPNFLTS